MSRKIIGFINGTVSLVKWGAALIICLYLVWNYMEIRRDLKMLILKSNLFFEEEEPEPRAWYGWQSYRGEEKEKKETHPRAPSPYGELRTREEK